MFDSLEQMSEVSDEPLPADFCTGMTCLGTPNEISSLIHAGYGNVLHSLTATAVIGGNGRIMSKKIPMVQPMSEENGCVMHKDGKCLLMQSGLTPLLGRLHLHSRGMCGVKSLKFLLHITVMEWLNEANAADVLFCLKSMEMSNEKLDSNPTN